MSTALCERTAIYHKGAARSFGALEKLKLTYHKRILVEQRKMGRFQDIELIKDAYHNITLIEKRQRELTAGFHYELA